MKNSLLPTALILLLSLKALAETPSAEALLKASDRSRGGVTEGLNWLAEISTSEDGDVSVRKFEIKAKESDSIAEALFPLRTKGEIYVFNDRNMWFIKPGLKKPVSISPRAKLTGLASNGDIATTWYARDYDGTIEKSEKLNGRDHYVLMLKAKNSSTTYDKIRYWIDAETQLASQAHFLTLDGQPLKFATFKYKNNLKVKGNTFPFVSAMEISDAQRKDYTSTIRYGKIKLVRFKTGEFNISNIRQ